MKPSFRLDQYPRRGPQPLSSPPAGYFERLPTRVIAQVALPTRRSLLPTWLRQAPAYVRTGLASTLLLGTLATTLWLGGGPLGQPTTPAASLDGVPQEQLVDYLTNDAPLSLLDLAELPPPPTGTPQYLRPSATELTDALDAQSPEEVATP